jgi:hypothetical protein
VCSWLSVSVSAQAIVEVLLGCVCRVLKASDSTACFSGGAETIVAAALEHSVGEPTVQEQFCLVVEALATDFGAKEELLAAGAKKAVNGAKLAIVNERHMTYPGRALTALGIN